MEYGAYEEYIMVLSDIIFYLLQDGCNSRMAVYKYIYIYTHVTLSISVYLHLCIYIHE